MMEGTHEEKAGRIGMGKGWFCILNTSEEEAGFSSYSLALLTASTPTVQNETVRHWHRERCTEIGDIISFIRCLLHRKPKLTLLHCMRFKKMETEELSHLHHRGITVTDNVP